MKKMIFTLNRQVLVLAILCIGLASNAAQVTVDISTKYTAQGTGTVETSVLQSALLAVPYTTAEIAAITDLKVTVSNGAFLDPKDFTYLKANLTSLSNLDLSQAVVSDRADGVVRETFPANTFQNHTTLKGIVFPQTMTSIGGGAFQSCALEGIISLPKSLNGAANAGFSRFGNSQKITGFAADPTSVYIATVDGVVFNKAMTEIHLYPSGKVDADYTIPEGVTTIMNSAFEANHHLKDLTIASTVSTTQAGNNRYDVIANQSEIENIYVTTGGTTYSSVNGILYQQTYQTVTNRVVWSPRGKSVLRITSPIKQIAGGGSQNSVFGGNANSNFGSGNIPNNYMFVPTLIDLPSTLDSIENGAFVGASNLGKLISRATVPPRIGTVTFNNIGATLTPQYSTKVYVPAANLDIYKTSNWAMIPATYKGFAQNAFIGFYNINLTSASAVSSIADDIAPENDVVTITADPAPAGQVFDKWVAVGTTVADETQPNTSFTMPASDVTITATYKADTGTGLNNIAKSDFTIFPNPASDYIQITGVTNSNYAIYSVIGKMVSSGVTNNSVISVSDLSDGVYILKIADKTKQFVKK